MLYFRGSSSAESQGGGVHLSYNSGEGGKQEMSCFTGPPTFGFGAAFGSFFGAFYPVENEED